MLNVISRTSLCWTPHNRWSHLRRNVTVMTFLLLYYLFSLMHELNVTVYLWMKAISSSPYTNKIIIFCKKWRVWCWCLIKSSEFQLFFINNTLEQNSQHTIFFELIAKCETDMTVFFNCCNSKRLKQYPFCHFEL